MGQLLAGLAGVSEGLGSEMARRAQEEQANRNRLRYLQESMRLQGEQAAAQQQRGFEHEARMRAAEELWKQAQRPQLEHEKRVALAAEQERLRLLAEQRTEEQRRGFEHEAQMRGAEELWKLTQRPYQEHKERVLLALQQEADRIKAEQQEAHQQRAFENEAKLRAAEWLAGGAERATREHERRRKEAFENEEAKRRRREEKTGYLNDLLKVGSITPLQYLQYMQSDPDLAEILGSGTPSGQAPTAPQRREGSAGEVAKMGIGTVGTLLGLGEPIPSETAPYGVEFSPQLPFWWQYKTAVESLQNLLGKPMGPGEKKTKNLSELIPETPSQKRVLRETRLRMP